MALQNHAKRILTTTTVKIWGTKYEPLRDLYTAAPAGRH
jgi:hypothetical protein